MDVYIEKIFLEEFSEKLRERDFADWKYLDRIIDFICNREVNLKNIKNIYPEELKDYILKSETTKKLESYFSSIPFEYNDENPISYYLIGNSNDAKKLRKEYFRIIYTLDELLNRDNNNKLFDQEPLNIKRELKSWNKLSEKILPFEYLFINDAYLFKNNEDALIEILTAVLKRSNKLKPINIYINTARNENESILKYITDYKKKIENTFNDFDINICISIKKYHKRFMITNYQFINSDQSFSIFFDTDEMITIIPFSQYLDSKKMLQYNINKSIFAELLLLIKSAPIFVGNKPNFDF